MSNLIIEFEPNRVLLSYPPQWNVYYKHEYELNFHKITMTYDRLKAFLEMYGIETNNINELKNFNINTTNIKENIKL